MNCTGVCKAENKKGLEQTFEGKSFSSETTFLLLSFCFCSREKRAGLTAELLVEVDESSIMSLCFKDAFCEDDGFAPLTSPCNVNNDDNK